MKNNRSTLGAILAEITLIGLSGVLPTGTEVQLSTSTETIMSDLFANRKPQEGSVPKEYTNEQIQEMFVNKIRGQIKYWESLTDHTSEQKLSGLAFSILATLDGCAVDLPMFLVVPAPHKFDKDFAKQEGLNWFPPLTKKTKDLCDIAGSLHNQLYKEKPKT